MYLEHLKRVLSAERGLHLTFSSGNTEQTIVLRPEVAAQVLQALQIANSKPAGEDQLTLTVLGHQIMRTPEDYGLLLRTQELGEVVFSLPRLILRRLATDLMRLASSPPLGRPAELQGEDEKFPWQDRSVSQLGFFVDCV